MAKERFHAHFFMLLWGAEQLLPVVAIAYLAIFLDSMFGHVTTKFFYYQGMVVSFGVRFGFILVPCSARIKFSHWGSPYVAVC